MLALTPNLGLKVGDPRRVRWDEALHIFTR